LSNGKGILGGEFFLREKVALKEKGIKITAERERENIGRKKKKVVL